MDANSTLPWNRAAVSALALLAALLTSSSTSPRTPAVSLATAKLHADYGRLPLAFEPNRGQAGPDVKFLARGSGYALQLTPGGAVLALGKSKPSADSTPSATLRWRLLEANPAPEIAGEAALPGIVNYYSGRNRATWLTNIPTFARVRYSSVLPGIDMAY